MLLLLVLGLYLSVVCATSIARQERYEPDRETPDRTVVAQIYCHCNDNGQG